MAAATVTAARLDLFVMSAADLPTLPRDRERLLRLMERETVLSGAAWAWTSKAPALRTSAG